MCGIIGYIGPKNIYRTLIEGLEQLEYRGYDSAGIAVLGQQAIHVHKQAGKVKQLKETIRGKIFSPSLQASYVGIGHTRWATHGLANCINAHPHLSQNQNIAIVHNGIVENNLVLKEQLIQEGYYFQSDTDTEVLVNFIEYIQRKHGITLLEAVRISLNKIIGAYAILIISIREPNNIIIAKRCSPLVIGIGTNEFIIASDVTAIMRHTKTIRYIENDELGCIQDYQLSITNLQNIPKTYEVQSIDVSLEKIEKGPFQHFMLKEIFEQPQSLIQTMRGRICKKNQTINLGSFHEYEGYILKAKKIVIISCGTSWHAGLVAEYFFEEFCRIPVEVEYASEFRYRNPIIYPGDIVVAISQSGETADTLAAVELAKEKGAVIIGICNVVNSSIARLTHTGFYTHAGTEIGVASTKGFTSQLMLLFILGLKIAHKKQMITSQEYYEVLGSMQALPDQIEQILSQHEQIQEIAEVFSKVKSFFYLGRGYNFPIALEGALKLKELSYIHAEGYPAAEMKHGPLALIDEETPTLVIATRDPYYEKMLGSIQEIKARKGKVIAITNHQDETIVNMVNYTIIVPRTLYQLTPILNVIPLQLLAYYIAIILKRDVDQPRNLAKSVTVE